MMRFSELLNRRYKLFLLLCILCMILLDLVVILARPLDLTEGGSSTWWMITKNLENGNGYKACDEAYVPNCMLTDQTTAIREPLPVLIYALLGTMTNNAPPAFQLTQLAFNLLICWLVFLLTQELGGRALGVIAALAWSVFLPTLRMEAHISGDLIAGSLVAAGTLFLVRAVKHGGLGQWIGFGFMFGLAVLSRSSALLIAFALFLGTLIFLWAQKKRFEKQWMIGLIVSGLALGLTVSPWVIRNQIAFGKPILGTTLVGYNLYRHNAIVMKEVFPHYVGSDEGYREIEALVARIPELQTPINEARVDAIFRREALRVISANRGEYLELVLFRFFPLWFNVGVLEQYGQEMLVLDYFVIAQQALLLVAFLIALWKGNWFLRMLALSVPFFMLGYMAIDSQLRYMIPAMPLVISVSVIGVSSFFTRRPQ